MRRHPPTAHRDRSTTTRQQPRHRHRRPILHEREPTPERDRMTRLDAARDVEHLAEGHRGDDAGKETAAERPAAPSFSPAQT